jgi:hypothetical protein
MYEMQRFHMEHHKTACWFLHERRRAPVGFRRQQYARDMDL